MPHHRVHGIWRLILVGLALLCCCSCAGRRYYRETPHARIAKTGSSSQTAAGAGETVRTASNSARRVPPVADLAWETDERTNRKAPALGSRKMGSGHDVDQKFHEKIAQRLGIDLDGDENKHLLVALDRWMGSPYRWGGCDESGIDCSCLVRKIFDEVYDIDLERTVQDMEQDDLRSVVRQDLRMGDLVFFRTFGSRVNHIGIYLKDGKFFHASQTTGVRVSDLDSRYYRGTFARAGRVFDDTAPRTSRLEIDDLVIRH